jgi:hypothetical protein
MTADAQINVLKSLERKKQQRREPILSRMSFLKIMMIIQ